MIEPKIGHTPALSLPYPLPEDPLVDYPATVGQPLAERIETLLSGSPVLALLFISGGTAIPTATVQPLTLLQNYAVNTEPAAFGPRGSAATAFTVLRAGWYLLTAWLAFPNNGTGARWTSIRKNGASPAPPDTPADVATPAATGLTTNHSLSTILRLAANDYVQLCGYQSSGVSLQPALNQGWIALQQLARPASLAGLLDELTKPAPEEPPAVDEGPWDPPAWMLEEAVEL
jgi:hypothetical protein